MIPLETLVCKVDGTQTIETREVPDDFFTPPTPEPTEAEKLQSQIDYLAMMTEVKMI